MLTSVVPSATRDELARAFAELGPLRDDPEPFLASLFASAARLPIDLTRMLLRFRGDPEASGILLIRGMPIDASLPPTPTTSSASGVKDRFVSEASILLVALMLGEPVAYAEEKNGVLVQNVYPIEAEKRSPSNESSETDLGFHTELSFSRNAPERPLHIANPDFLLLFGLRAAPSDDAVTTLAEAGDICRWLSRAARATLSEPLFQLRAPYSFTQPNGIERTWSPSVPLFHGSDGITLMAFDLACGVRATTPQAAGAIEELRQVLSRSDVQHQVRLGPGDLLVVHNRKCAHARSRFEARFDGSDRWLQRVYVRRSLEGLPRSNGRSFRVI